MEYAFEYVFGGKEGFHQRNENQNGQQVAVAPHLRFDVRMADVQHTSDAESQGDDDSDGESLHYRTVPPVVKLTVVEEVGDFKQ